MQVNGVMPRIYILMENVSLVGIDLRSICSELPLQQAARLTLAVFILLFNEKLVVQGEQTCSSLHKRYGVWKVLSSHTHPLSHLLVRPPLIDSPIHLFFLLWHECSLDFFSIAFILDLEKPKGCISLKYKINSVNKNITTHRSIHTITTNLSTKHTKTVNYKRSSFSSINPKKEQGDNRSEKDVI